MTHQIDNINKNIEIIKRTKQKCWNWEKYDNWNENFTKGLNSRFEQAEGRISKLGDRSIEMIQSDKQMKKMKRASQT